MAVQGRPILGIDINASEITVVEIQGSGPNPQVLRADSAPTPHGAMEGGRITDAESLAAALRDLLTRMRVTTREAVMGLAARAVMTRTLDVPSAPDSEMRTIIEGELAHYQILPENVGTFDYLRLKTAENTNEGQQVLLMASESMTVGGYSEVAERAGLRLVALEPAALGMLRSAASQIAALPGVLCLIVPHGELEIAVLERGQLRLYRRIDISSDDLLPTRKPTADRRHDTMSSTRIPFGFVEEEEEAPTPGAPAAPEGPMNRNSANALAIELQRSLDYYHGEFAPSEPIQHVVVVNSITELSGLAEWLAGALPLHIEPAAIPADSGSVLPPQPEQQGRFLGATGLAMRETSNLPSGLPRFNLSTLQRAEAIVVTAQRRLVLSLAASIVVILMGLFMAWRIGVRANKVDHELSHLQEHIAALQKDKQTRLDALQARKIMLNALQTQGFAFPQIMDTVQSAVGPEAGLTEVSLNQFGQVRIQGEAHDNRTLIQTLEGLKRSPYFEGTGLDSFDSSATASNMKHVVKFQISAQLTGVKRQETASAKTP